MFISCRDSVESASSLGCTCREVVRAQPPTSHRRSARAGNGSARAAGSARATGSARANGSTGSARAGSARRKRDSAAVVPDTSPPVTEEKSQQQTEADLAATLLYACARGDVEAVRTARPSIVAQAVDDRGFRALHFACAAGSLEIVRLLCGPTFCADPHVLAARAQLDSATPVLLAARFGHVEVLEYLADEHRALEEECGAPKGWQAWSVLVPPPASLSRPPEPLRPLLRFRQIVDTAPPAHFDAALCGKRRTEVREKLAERLGNHTGSVVPSASDPPGSAVRLAPTKDSGTERSGGNAETPSVFSVSIASPAMPSSPAHTSSPGQRLRESISGHLERATSRIQELPPSSPIARMINLLPKKKKKACPHAGKQKRRSKIAKHETEGETSQQNSEPETEQPSSDDEVPVLELPINGKAAKAGTSIADRRGFALPSVDTTETPGSAHVVYVSALELAHGRPQDVKMPQYKSESKGCMWHIARMLRHLSPDLRKRRRKPRRTSESSEA